MRDTLAPTTTPPEAAPAASAPFGRHRPLVVALWATWLPLLLVGFGMVVRIRQYVFNRSPWLDEGMIAGNIINRSYGELLQPLADHQGTPVGWLWLQRTMVLALGDGERALRLVPLVAGVAVLLVALKVARVLLPGWLVPVAVAFMAVSPFLIRYSNEAKQYQTDVLAGLVLLALSLPLVVGPLDRRRLAIWSVVAAAAIWFSHPTVFFVAGFTAVLVAVRLARRDWSSLAALAVACLPWAASLLANHYWFLRRLGGDDKLLRYFERGFPPEPASPVGMVAWLADKWEAFVRAPLGMGKAAVVAVLVLAGLVALIRAAPAQTALLIAPVLLLIAAAVLRRYALEGRLLLALVPIALLVVVAAADWGWRRGVVATVAGLIALGALLIPITANSVAMTRRLTQRRSSVRFSRRCGRCCGRATGFSSTPGRGPPSYYAARLGLHGDAVVSLGRRPGDCDDRRALAWLAAGQRVWAVFSHRLLATPRDNQLRIHAQLLGYGPWVASVRSRGARADLYDPAALTSTTQAARPVAPGAGCLLLGPIPPAQPGGQA